MNLKTEYENTRIKATKLRREQLNWCIENEVGEIIGKTFYLDKKAIFGVFYLDDEIKYMVKSIIRAWGRVEVLLG